MTNGLSTIKLFEVSKLKLLRVLDSATETLKIFLIPSCIAWSFTWASMLIDLIVSYITFVLKINLLIIFPLLPVMTSNPAVTFWHPQGTIYIPLKKGINRLFSKAVRVISKKLFLLILFCFALFFFLRTCYEKYVICNLSRRQNSNIGVQTFSSKTVKFSHQWTEKFSFSLKIERKRTECLLTPFHLRHYYDFLIEFRLACSTKDHN